MPAMRTRLLDARAPIASHGAGGFQMSGKTLAGSLIIAPGGVFSWPGDTEAARMEELLRFVAEEQGKLGEFVLIGTGAASTVPSKAVRAALDERGLGLEFMTTGAACRTYNVVLAEGRLFTAALLAE